MSNPVRIASVPFIRIAVPFIFGILLYGKYPSVPVIVSIAGLTAVLLAGTFVYRKEVLSRCKSVFVNSTIFTVLFGLGWLAAAVHSPVELGGKQLNTPCYITFRLQQISHKDITTELWGEATTAEGQSVNLAMTLKGNNYSLKAGDILYCHTALEKIRNSGNPESFDYVQFMRNKGILYRAFITADDYTLIGHRKTLQTLSVGWRDRMISHIRLTGIDSKTADFAATVLTGDKVIGKDVQEAFADAGLAHILAVSGLHIGVIISIVSFLLCPLRNPRLKVAKLVISLAAVWIYVVFTGLSPSATRAAIMATFVFTSKGLLKKNSSINALFAAAFFILLYSPSSVYDIGFQLSFLSVAGILLFAERLTYRTNYWIFNYLSASVAVTVSAQLGALPLMVFYFHSIPSGFLLSNILVVPILPIFMFFLLSSVVLSLAGWSWGVFICLLDAVYAIIEYVSMLSRDMFPALNGLWIDSFSTLLIVIAIFSTGIIWRFELKRAFFLVPAALFAISLLSVISVKMTMPQSGVFISDEYTSTNIVCYDAGKVFIVNSKNDTSEISQFIANNRRFFIRQGFDSIFKTSNPISRENIRIDYPAIFAHGKSYLFLVGNYRKRHSGRQRVHADYAIVTNNFYSQLSELPQFIDADTLVFPNEIYKTRRDTLIDYAVRHNIRFIAP